MKKLTFLPFAFLTLVIFFSSCSEKKGGRVTENFNFDWQFYYADTINTDSIDPKNHTWENVQLPHDYSIEQGFSPMLDVDETLIDKKSSSNQSNLPTGIEAMIYNGYRRTGASTGFVPGGVGWYRKTFEVSRADKDKEIFIEFDGIYCNSKVWINGHMLGFRPNGYTGFTYNLTPFLKYGEENEIQIKVDHTNYIDQRWYAGSGIYRNVKLVKKGKVNIPYSGVKISTPEVSDEKAVVKILPVIDGIPETGSDIEVIARILSPEGEIITSCKKNVAPHESANEDFLFDIENPQLWDIDSPVMYSAEITVLNNGNISDNTTIRFGIRYFEFTPDKGFFLNGRHVKIKGVNLHQDAGNLGAAVPKDEWLYRLHKLKDFGCNAVRTAHHPFSTDFYDACDEVGLLVMSEFFDEWTRPKKKNATQLGSADAPDSFAGNYTEYFNEWAERDVKECLRRDFNHPSIILWSIGNEIEWTYWKYGRTYGKVNGKVEYYVHEPIYDSVINRTAYEQVEPKVDSLATIAKILAKYVKDEDTSRPVTLGSVMPVVGMVSGLAQIIDVFGFNYRTCEYSGAHEEYPDLKILGTENFNSYGDWKEAVDRDYVAGIFTWTGMAYLGEGGPYPRRGLDVSFFDLASFKNPRGHFYECLWNDTPKVYAATVEASESEFKYVKDSGFRFEEKKSWHRRWLWYDAYESWNYEEGDSIVVQGYTNCEEAEIFINGTSFGKKKLSDNNDNVIKWLVPYNAGELKIIGYNNGEAADEYALKTAGKPFKISLKADKNTLKANGENIAHIEAYITDKNGIVVPDNDIKITFQTGEGLELIAVDNGSEWSVDHPKGKSLTTNKGKALGIVRAGTNTGICYVEVSADGLESGRIEIGIERP